MGVKKNRHITSKILILFFGSLLLLSALSLGISIYNKSSNTFPSTLIPSMTGDISKDKISANNFDYYKEFTVNERTGSNQTNVIIDPVSFYETDISCFKDSIRLYKSPYGAGNEIVSQVYNLEPNAYEIFSSSPDWENPSAWTVSAPTNTQITVLPRFGGYRKVVQFYDNDTTNYCQMYRGIGSRTSGTYYITALMATTNNTNAIGLAAASGWAIGFGFNASGTFYYSTTGSVSINTGVVYEIGKWYTFKITFDCATWKYTLWYWNDTTLNWVTLANSVDFVYHFSPIINTLITSGVYYKGSFYVAALDYSWATGYMEDRILYASSANIAFIDSLNANQIKSYRIYYSDYPTIPAGYTNIQRNNYTLNFTDGDSVIIYTGADVIRQFDKNGKEHMSGASWYYETSTYETPPGGDYVFAKPFITDGPIFTEAWHVDSALEWSFYKYYANSYIYKYHNFSGSGKTAWCTFGGEATVSFDFVGMYYHQVAGWQNETFVYPGGSWVHKIWPIDQGKTFQEKTGDPNILITLWDKTPDTYLGNLHLMESDPMDLYIGFGNNPDWPYYGQVTHSFGAWQFYEDAGSTNVNVKENFVDKLYNVILANPPAIGILSSRNSSVDNQTPSILGININKMNPYIFDIINITVHITENTQISKVRIYTDLFGTFQYYNMNLSSGNTSNGYWSFISYIPWNANGKTITYSIWANDTSGLTTNSSSYQFTVKYLPIFWFQPPGGNIIIIIIIIGSITSSSVIVSTVVVKKKVSKVKTKEMSKAKVISKIKPTKGVYVDSKVKSTKGVYLGAEEIRKILKESEEQGPVAMDTYQDLEKIITKPLSVLSNDIYTRVRNLTNLTDEEKEMLLEDLAGLDDEQIEKWLKKVEELKE